MIYLCLFCAQKLALGDRAGLSEYHVLVSASGSNDWKMYAVLITVTVKVVPV